MMIKTRTPPLARAYGRDSDPAPTMVVRRMKMDDGIDPRVSLESLRLHSLVSSPLLASSPTLELALLPSLPVGESVAALSDIVSSTAI